MWWDRLRRLWKREEESPLELHARLVARELYRGLCRAQLTDVAGEVAEFGTQTGSSAVALAQAIRRSEAQTGPQGALYGLGPRRLHLFDSFAGLPEVRSPVDAASPHVRSGVWAPGSLRGLSPRDLRARVCRHLPADRVDIFAGWFQDSLPPLRGRVSYALVHLDCDFYSSTMDVLLNLFEGRMLGSGAQLFFDDWECNRSSPEWGERRAWEECVRRYQVSFSDDGPYGLMARRFTVHSYSPEPAAG